jgi:ParB family chromosome partitioning protein
MELAASIRDHGVMQPITVRRVGEGEAVIYILIAGERRTRACKMAQRETIPAIVLDVADDRAVEMALIENIQRENLGVMDEARALNGLLDRFEGNIERVAMTVKKSLLYVRERIQLLSLHEQIQSMVDRGEINLAQAKVILEIASVEDQIKAAKEAHALQLNANQLKGRTQHLKKKTEDEGARKKRKASFAQLSRGIVTLFDLVEGVSFSDLSRDQKDTLAQQIDTLVDRLDQCKEELGAVVAPPEEPVRVIPEASVPS